MPLIYITGPPASGKTTLLKELRKRSFRAYDADEEGIGAAFNKVNNEQVVVPFVDARTPEWFEAHEWRLIPEMITKLASREGPIFLCGSAANDRNLWYFFDQIFYLDITEGTLRKRIISRAGDENDFGQNEHELALILARRSSERWKRDEPRVVSVNVDQPVNKVLDYIIGHLETNNSNFFMP